MTALCHLRPLRPTLLFQVLRWRMRHSEHRSCGYPTQNSWDSSVDPFLSLSHVGFSPRLCIICMAPADRRRCDSGRDPDPYTNATKSSETGPGIEPKTKRRRIVTRGKNQQNA
jgi:hypothetical protein